MMCIYVYSTYLGDKTYKVKNRGLKNGGKSAKSRRATTSFLKDLLVTFPSKNTAKFGVQNGVVASETRRKFTGKIYTAKPRSSGLS
jgi:hypothetical protein